MFMNGLTEKGHCIIQQNDQGISCSLSLSFIKSASMIDNTISSKIDDHAKLTSYKPLAGALHI